MKKSFFALTVLAALTGTVQAQSNILIYGAIDGGLRNLTNTDISGHSKLTMGAFNGTYTANRLGFKGTEDLGNGLNAHFNLESGFNGATGTLDNSANVLFNRISSVGVGGAWGSVDFGRIYTVAFRTIRDYEPLVYQYVSITLASAATAGVRSNNDIQYTGKFGDLTIRGEYAPGEIAGSTSNGATQAAGLAYSSGPYSLGGAYTQKKTAAGLEYKHSTLGGAFKINQFKFSAGYANEKQATATVGASNKYAWGGVNVQLSALKLTAAYYHLKNATGGKNGKKTVAILSADYALSKRTSLYGGIDRNTFGGGLIPASTQTKQVGISTGISHFF